MKYLSIPFGLAVAIFLSSFCLKSTCRSDISEDTFLLLAQPWTSDSIFLDLKINGQFEGRIYSVDVQGRWDVQDNQNTLLLSNDPIDEEEFEWRFTISDISYFKLELIDKEGVEICLQPTDAMH